ncbi:MAG: 30S ribosomal protein S21, partial [Rhodothermales bacterium]|nr:30S ribosomal protein S21 [Rhodothermales bacterium]
MSVRRVRGVVVHQNRIGFTGSGKASLGSIRRSEKGVPRVETGCSGWERAYSSSALRCTERPWRRTFTGSHRKGVTSNPRFAVPVGIKVRDNESIDRALRRFKRAVNRSRVLRLYRENMAFVKP